MHPREESNLHLTLRTGLLYPLSYRGLSSDSIPEECFSLKSIHPKPIVEIVQIGSTIQIMAVESSERPSTWQMTSNAYEARPNGVTLTAVVEWYDFHPETPEEPAHATYYSLDLPNKGYILSDKLNDGSAEKRVTQGISKEETDSIDTITSIMDKHNAHTITLTERGREGWSQNEIVRYRQQLELGNPNEGSDHFSAEYDAYGHLKDIVLQHISGRMLSIRPTKIGTIPFILSEKNPAMPEPAHFHLFYDKELEGDEEAITMRQFGLNSDMLHVRTENFSGDILIPRLAPGIQQIARVMRSPNPSEWLMTPKFNNFGILKR